MLRFAYAMKKRVMGNTVKTAFVSERMNFLYYSTILVYGKRFLKNFRIFYRENASFYYRTDWKNKNSIARSTITVLS